MRRKIQRVQRADYHTFDEELWPVNVALVILAGFVAGAIIAVSRFDDPQILQNGWFRLTSLAITTGALIWAASRLPTRGFRRTMQFAAVLAILAHLVLIGTLYTQRIAYRQETPADSEVTVLEAPVTLPEYHEEEAPQDFEQPVETHAPEEVQPTPVEREETESETPTQSQPTPEPGKTPEVDPAPVEKAAITEAAPRRADEQSQLSKQTAKAEPRPNEAIAAPQEQIPSEQQAELQPDTQPVERTAQAQPEATRPAEQPTPALPVQRQVTKLARRDIPETLPTKSPSAPTLNRALNQPQEVPKVAAEAPQPVAASPAAKPNELKPNSVEIVRESATPDVAQQMAAEPKSAAAPQPVAMDAARQPQADAPQLARSPEASPQKATTEAPLPTNDAASAPEATVQATAPGVSPAPSQTELARTAAESPAAVDAAASGDVASAPPTTITGASLAKAERADAPSMTPQAAAAAAPARAARAAEVAASPMNVESPSVAVAEQARPEATPTRSALSKGAAGIAGVGRDVNFDHGEMATRNPAPVPSASAKRAAASQTEPVGPALSPSAPALVAKSMAGANVPQATLAAQDVASGNVAGARTPTNIEASSSAAVVRADASAPTGKVTAAAGRTEFDVGPTQIVANAGSGRPAGGGAPEVRLDKQSTQFSRQASGGSPLSAIAAGTVAEAPQAPAAAGGGAPAPVLGSHVPAAVKSSAGGTAAMAGVVAAPATGGATSAVASATLARASTGQEGIPGSAQPGGVAAPSRSTGRMIAANTAAEQIQMAAGPATGAASPGSGVSAPADLAVKSSAGLPGRVSAQPVGVLAAEVAVDAQAIGAPGMGIARRAAEASNESAPTVAATGSPGLQRNTNVAGMPQGQIATIDAPNMDAAPSAAGGAAGSMQPSKPSATGLAARSSGALPVQVAALEGPGGLALTLTPNVGSISRQARRDSAIIHPGAARFLSRTVGGPLAIDGRAREPAAAFSRRRGRKLDPSGEYGQPLERTEEAVELGLDFLIRHQSADGRWSLHNYGIGRPGYEKETSQLHSDTAATGLALLAFLGAGYDHYDDQYAAQIRQALEFLVKNQKEDGDLFLPMDAESNKSVWLYSHGIATIALCEAFGMTGDADLREPAQKAIDFIVAAQNKNRGGWRYVPGRDSDTSVSGWQLMALKSGELAGLTVPTETYTQVEKWLDTAQSSQGGQTMYAYNPFAPLQTAPGRFADHGRRPTPPTTSMGLLMRLYTGWNRDDPRMRSGCDYLLENPPQLGTAQQPLRDSYYWYYATQLMFHMKGDYWKQWNARLHPLLVDQQVSSGPFAGSWDPRHPVPDRWGFLGGRIYVTTVNLLSLEVYYRHLPIYEDTAK